MRAAKIVAFGVLSLAAAYGCSTADADEDPPSAEGKLVGFAGNVDHAGIVEMGTVLMTTGTLNPIADSNLDAYNQEDPFQVKGTFFHDTLAKNLLKFDAIDGKTDWTPELSAKWLARLGSNYLVVDTSKPCDFADPHTYLEIERAQLTGKEHVTCGGRMPNEDVLDVTFNFLAGGPAASVNDPGAMSDGVDQATQKSTDTFPYLAELNE